MDEHSILLHRLCVTSALFPPACAVDLTEVTVEQASVRLQRTATAPAACGPDGAVPSAAIPSRYQRHLTDLPWGPRAVRLKRMVRTFGCCQPNCPRRIFPERLPDLVAPSARTTTRLLDRLRAMGLALGGQARARRAARLRWSPRPPPLLRRVRAACGPSTPALQAVGRAAWAGRRGHRDGTLLVELTPNRVVALRPDRAATTVAAWLAPHPTLTVVCRDRRALSADGIRRGTPEAVPGVERLPLVPNLRQALAAFLITARAAMPAAALGTAPALRPLRSSEPGTRREQGRRPSATKGPRRTPPRPRCRRPATGPVPPPRRGDGPARPPPRALPG
jgi:hypothetical protein